MEIHQCKDMVDYVLREGNLTWDEYAKNSPDEKKKLIADSRKKLEEGYRPSTEVKVSTHEEAVKALEEWKKAGRISMYSKARYLLPVLTLQDMNLLIDTRAALYSRASDESMYEIGDISGAMKSLTRSSYRKTPGLTEKADLK
jgi:hypothetical protein